jgi:LysM repeat protein
MNTRRLILYLILNAIVSASATLAVLWVWDRAHAPIRAANPLPTVSVAAGPTAALPTKAPSPPVVASPTPTIHVVQAGDTLGSIAEQYDVSVEDIMAANGLADPDVLDVGQTLVIPVGGFVLLTPTVPSLPTSTVEASLPTATRDPSAPRPQLTIREVKSPGVLADEALVIVNTGGPVDLAGWTLRDEAGTLYTFPSLTLFEGGAVTLHTAAGEDTVTDLYWGLAAPVWAAGKAALLSDANGALHARFTAP